MGIQDESCMSCFELCHCHMRLLSFLLGWGGRGMVLSLDVGARRFRYIELRWDLPLGLLYRLGFPSEDSPVQA